MSTLNIEILPEFPACRPDLQISNSRLTTPCFHPASPHNCMSSIFFFNFIDISESVDVGIFKNLQIQIYPGEPLPIQQGPSLKRKSGQCIINIILVISLIKEIVITCLSLDNTGSLAFTIQEAATFRDQSSPSDFLRLR